MRAKGALRTLRLVWALLALLFFHAGAEVLHYRWHRPASAADGLWLSAGDDDCPFCEWDLLLAPPDAPPAPVESPRVALLTPPPPSPHLPAGAPRNARAVSRAPPAPSHT